MTLLPRIPMLDARALRWDDPLLSTVSPDTLVWCGSVHVGNDPWGRSTEASNGIGGWRNGLRRALALRRVGAVPVWSIRVDVYGADTGGSLAQEPLSHPEWFPRFSIGEYAALVKLWEGTGRRWTRPANAAADVQDPATGNVCLPYIAQMETTPGRIEVVGCLADLRSPGWQQFCCDAADEWAALLGDPHWLIGCKPSWMQYPQEHCAIPADPDHCGMVTGTPYLRGQFEAGLDAILREMMAGGHRISMLTHPPRQDAAPLYTPSAVSAGLTEATLRVLA